jgi:hypothetical protein
MRTFEGHFSPARAGPAPKSGENWKLYERDQKEILQHRQPLGNRGGQKNRNYPVDLRGLLSAQKNRIAQSCQEQETGRARAGQATNGIATERLKAHLFCSAINSASR